MKARAGRRALALASALVVVMLCAFLPAHADVPANDDFGNAVRIATLPFAATVDTTSATVQDGEPTAQDVCASAGASVWYEFTPDATERLAAATTGSSFDAFVGVYSGTALNDLSLLACGKKAFFTVEAGTSYWFQVGGSGLDGGGNIVPLAGLANFSLEYHAPVPPACNDCPAFRNYPVSEDDFSFADKAGETSIGVDPKTNAAMFLMGVHTLKATWDENGAITWTQVDGPTAGLGTNDPILWTDRATGRTFVVQLHALGEAGASVVEYTDDDGRTWNETEPAQVNPSWDHESLGGGPYPLGLKDANPLYPNALYYCAQLGAPASECARSDDGGITWGPQLPMNLTNCDGLHGHIAVGPDGTVYVPHKSCGKTQGVISSANGGLTWSFSPIPNTNGTGAFGSDPKIAFDASGRMYFATESGGHPVVSVSTDGGHTWSDHPHDVGVPFGIQNTEFPMIVAGDDGRAAMAFYGTQTDGSDQAADFPDEWHLYVSYTYDGGDTWQTVDTTPADPVQRGCIWLQGGLNKCRNLLDFQDMTMDNHGRVLVGYADGCHTDTCRGVYGTYVDSEHDAQGVIARQSSGKGLLAAYDGKL